MSDNTTLPVGTGGDTIRTIDRTTSKTQVVGLDVGGEPGPESLVTASNPLPVSVGNFPATQAVSGTVTSNQGIPGATAWKVDGSGVTQPVSGTVTTTPPANASTNVTQFGGNPVVTGTGVSGIGIPRVTVSSDSFPSAQSLTLKDPTFNNFQSVNLNGRANVTAPGLEDLVLQCLVELRVIVHLLAEDGAGDSDPDDLRSSYSDGVSQ